MNNLFTQSAPSLTRSAAAGFTSAPAGAGRRFAVSRRIFAAAIVALCAVCCGTSLQAAPFQNGSFEDNDGNGDSYAFAATGWVIISNSQDWVSADIDFSVDFASVDGATDGNYAAVFHNNGTPPVGSIAQTFDTVPGQQYTLAFDFGTQSSQQQSLHVSVSNSDLPAQVAVSGVNGSFAQTVFSFTATDTSSTITFTDDPQNDFHAAFLDNVEIGRYLFANPFANAGPDQTVKASSPVFLNGGGSYDGNFSDSSGDFDYLFRFPDLPLNYKWTQVSGPTVTLHDDSSQYPQFTAPNVPASGAAVVFSLSVYYDKFVTDGAASSDTVTINVTGAMNAPPVANAGPDQTVGENTVVTLDGSQSSDAENDALTVHWTQIAGPAVTLDAADSVNPSFTAPDVTAAQGTVDVKFQLVANDGQASSGPSTVTIHVKNTNDAPTANAGTNQSVNELDAVTLDGTASSDPDNDALTYAWTQILGTPVVTLSGGNTATPSFTAPALNVGGAAGSTTLTFQLIVNDGKVSSTANTVNVIVKNVNHAPIADAGENRTVPSNTLVTLNGANSADVDGDTLSYSWVQTSGPSVTLTGANTATPSFTTPVAGTSGLALKFQLAVNDGFGGVTSGSTTVNVTYVNHPPTANAGIAQTVNEGTTATLAGQASDPDGNNLTINWAQISGPAVTINNASTLTPSFAAPLVTRAEADVVLRLSVDDGYGGTASSDVAVHIANINHPPAALAPANLSVPEGTLVTLIGQGKDPDTEEQSQLTYSWQQIGPVIGSAVAGATLSFNAPLVTAGGDPNAKMTMTFRLTVTDPNKVSDTSDTVVTVTNVDHAPTAVAGGNLNVNEAASVTLNGSASSDPDNDPLTYAWVQIAGPTVTLHNANTAYPDFTAPFVNAAGATLKFQLTVKDPFGGTSSASSTVTVANINDPPISTNARPSLGVLWPPDHSMVRVSILGVFDPNNNATIKITGVTQDEATNGLGDGDTAIDAIINADGTVLLRAERAGNGNGRVYHIHFTASDFEGSSSGVVKVSVPHDKKADIAIDGGELFDSTR